MTPPTSGMTDDEIKALLKKYQACSERGHPAPDCICNGIAMENWKELAREVLAARETIYNIGVAYASVMIREHDRRRIEVFQQRLGGEVRWLTNQSE